MASAPWLQEKEWRNVELYLKAGIEPKRIAESFMMSLEDFKSQVKERYARESIIVFNSFRTMGEIMLEVAQYQKALSGNIQMLIFLGRVRLGQREPDLIATIPPAQDEIDKDHLIMMLNHKVDTLNEILISYGNEPQAK